MSKVIILGAVLVLVGFGDAVSAAQECRWAYSHATQFFKPIFGNAREACAFGLSKSYTSGYAAKLTGIERVPSSVIAYRCLVMLQACKTCEWTVPKEPWRVDGFALSARMVDAAGNPVSDEMVEDSSGVCLRPDVSQQLGAADTQSCSEDGGGKQGVLRFGFVGNPINVLNGNKYQVVEIYASPSASINLSIAYNSHNGAWLHSYSDRLYFYQDKIFYYNAKGKSYAFKVQGAEIFPLPAGAGSLSRLAAGYELSHPVSGRLVFDAAGRVTSVQRPGLMPISIAYELGGMSNFSSFSIQRRLLTLTSAAGEVIKLTDDGLGGFVALEAGSFKSNFIYSTTGLPVRLTKQNGSTAVGMSFVYGDARFPKYLTAFYDERGVKYASWVYDSQGRAISSQHMDGADQVSIAYNSDGSATVTNPLGRKHTYRFAVVAGMKRVTAIEGEPTVNCPSSNSTFSYDQQGLLKAKTDNKGILTTYDYNEHGLEISRTEASGTPEARIITTEWHPTLFLPTVITEPDRITRYQYDDQGRQLSRTVDAR